MARYNALTNDQIDEIKNLFELTSKTYTEIAIIVGISQSCVSNTCSKLFGKNRCKERKSGNYAKSKIGSKNPMFDHKREAHHNYKGVISDCKGYQLIAKPDWYTGRKKSAHIFYHHYVICENMGLTEIPKGYCVHHCDHNSKNNDFSNLVLIKMSDHAALHSYLKKERATTISKESTLKWVEARRQNNNSV